MPVLWSAFRRSPEPSAPPGAAAFALVAILVLAKGVVWTVVQPPLQAPDEAAHLTYVQYLAEEGRLPRVGPAGDDSAEALGFRGAVRFDEVRFRPDVRYRPLPVPVGLSRLTPDGNSSASGYPPGYYALAAVGYRAAYAHGIAARFYAARLVSVLLGLVTALAAWAAGRTLFPSAPGAAVALAIVVSMQPMNSMAAGSLNNDALLVPAAAAATAIALREGTRRPVALGLALGIGLLAKPQMIFVAFALGAPLLGRLRRTPRAAALFAAKVSGAALAVYGAWALTALARFGNPMGTMVFQTVGNGDPSLWHYVRNNFLEAGAFERMGVLWFRTFWGRFGWLDTPLPEAAFTAIRIATLLAAAGLVVAFLRRREPGRGPIAFAALFVAGNIAFLYAVEALYVRRYHATMLQGRYLLTALLPIALLLLAGWRALVPRGREAWADAAAAAAALALNALSLRALLFRYYGIGLRDAVAHPERIRGVVPGPLFAAAEVAAVVLAVLAAAVLVSLAAEAVRGIGRRPALVLPGASSAFPLSAPRRASPPRRTGPPTRC